VIATLSDETLAAIRARLNAATPGPYRLETDSCDCGGDYNCGHGEHPYALRMPIHNINYADTPCDQAEPIDRHRHLASDISELTMETAEFIRRRTRRRGCTARRSRPPPSSRPPSPPRRRGRRRDQH
jgi:hypothetical protein